MSENTESQRSEASPQYTPRTEAQELDFYRRMYFEYVELFTSTAADAIQFASEGRWYDLIEMCSERLDARDAVQEGGAEVYKLAKPRAKVADAAPDLLAALHALVDDCSNPKRLHLISLPVLIQVDKAFAKAEERAQ